VKAGPPFVGQRQRQGQRRKRQLVLLVVGLDPGWGGARRGTGKTLLWMKLS